MQTNTIHAQQNSDGNWTWFMKDGLGSVRSEVNAALEINASTNHTPYGEPVDVTGISTTSYGYTGEMVDNNDLVYLRARYYAPEMGVFPSLDPVEGNIDDVMALNQYGYVTGNPVNLVDPSGRIHEHPGQKDTCQSPRPPKSCPPNSFYNGFGQCCFRYDRSHAVEYAIQFADESEANRNPTVAYYGPPEENGETNCAVFGSQVISAGNHPMAYPGGRSSLQSLFDSNLINDTNTPSFTHWAAIPNAIGKSEGTLVWRTARYFARYIRDFGAGSLKEGAGQVITPQRTYVTALSEFREFGGDLDRNGIGKGDILYWNNPDREHIAIIVGWGPTEIDIDIGLGTPTIVDRWLYWGWLGSNRPLLEQNWRQGLVPYIVDNGRTWVDDVNPIPYYLLKVQGCSTDNCFLANEVEFIKVPDLTCVSSEDYIERVFSVTR